MQSLAWYYRRVSHVSAPEVLHRCRRLGRTLVGRFRPWTPAKWLSVGNVWSGPCTAEYFRNRRALLGHDPARLRPEDVTPRQLKGCIEEADNLLAHRFEFFRFANEPLGDRIDWNYDYRNRKSIPLVYAPRLDYRDKAVVGDVKYVWELNRHQHLVRLGQAYVLSGDERYAGEAARQITDWIDQCPHMRGINWTCPLEAALRLISWAWTFELIRRWRGMTDGFVQLLSRSVHQQLAFIDRNYSLHSSANNHLIGQASGAYVAAAYWPELKCADRWWQRARQILIRECLRQNSPDGVNREQALGYQFFVFDLLLLPAVLGRANGEAFPRRYWDRLEKMAEFIACVSDCNGNTPNVGDGDDGFAIRLDARGGSRAQSLLDTALTAFMRRDFQALADNSLGEKSLWLFGAQGQKLRRSLWPLRSGPPLRQTRAFDDGGYYVFRSGDTDRDEAVLLFDCGPLGLEPLAAHGHADALSLTLHVAGKPFLIDPGTFNYADERWRPYFKATAQHNTLCFGEQSQAEYKGPFLWGGKPSVERLQFSRQGDAACAKGRVVWCSGEIHERTIRWSPRESTIVIEDSWRGRTAPVLRFCLAPGIGLRREGDRLIADGEGASITLCTEGGDIEEQQAWCSQRLYHKCRTSGIRIRTPHAEGRCITRIRWEIADGYRRQQD
ncbi:MAG: alginate lyase family protein [Planctomycetota bacterium]|nr:alginate lyase family protein [Planctomycetota bacterium]